MKKILSFFMAGVLALGLIGCSGDLHDSTYTEDCIGLYLAGDINKDGNTRDKLKFIDAHTQELTFTYKSSMNTWGGGNGKINFKLVTDATTWTQDFGWKKDIAQTIALNDDYLELYARDSANTNPGNIVVENLIEGKEYTIRVDYDAANLVAKVKIEGEAIDFPTLRVVKVDGEGEDVISYTMTREGTTYTYIQTAEEDGSFKYYITNGYLYYGADGEATTFKPANDDLATFTYKKGDPYAITVKTAFDKTADVTVESGFYDTTILKDAGLVGSHFGWDGATKLVKDDDTTYHYDFTAEAADQSFSIQKVAGSWDARWCGQDSSAKDSEDKWIKSKYLTVEADKPAAALSYITSGAPEHAHMKLLKDSKYSLIFTITGDNAVSVELKLLEKVEAKVIDLTGYGARGLFGNWSDLTDIEFTKQADGSYTLEFEATAASSDCKIANGDWKAYPLDKAGTCQNFVANGTEYNFYPGDSGMSNPQLSGMTVGSTYIMMITPSTDYITVKVSEKK